ncbi:hypothetical protein [uncultured Roseobacter sp.]|uniref:hypothetical protein n=1 Tax=uncultured Roseobacter sp. TaxID=114847 RepID=UPI00261FA88B|nr:hypothetical protein [uncultured Roseobacter sp.]
MQRSVIFPACIALTLGCLLQVAPASAATVVINDGDLTDYDPDDDYIFDLALTDIDPTVTLGFNLDAGEAIPFVLNSPSNSSILAAVTTGPDGSGTTLINFQSTGGGPFEVFANTTIPFEMEAAFGATQWWTISLAGQAGEAALVDGPLYLAALMSPAAAKAGRGTFSFVSDASGTQTTFYADDGDGGTGPSSVPLPAAGWLLLASLGVMFRFGRGRQHV